MILPDKTQNLTEDVILALAREIAMNVNNLETILEAHRIPHETWRILSEDPKFNRLLQSQVIAWESATNSQERLKVKSAALIEAWLEKANSYLHNGELTAPKVELAKFVARLAGVGLDRAGIDGGGERFAITINLGADSKLKFEKTLPPKVIDAEPVEA
ncbi:MAG: hypothetical protein ACXWCQ_32295 [Burkholderiales bacterium]